MKMLDVADIKQMTKTIYEACHSTTHTDKQGWNWGAALKVNHS